MQIKKCKNPKIWEKFIKENQPHNFLQSFWWGKVLQNEGRIIDYWEIWDNEELQGVVLMEKRKVFKNSLFYLESLWGPVWSKELTGSVKSELLRRFYCSISENKKGIFWRLSPPACVLISPRYPQPSYYLESGCLEPNFSWEFFPTLAKTRPPKRTIEINLLEEEKEILDKMKSKTRYNIRLAQRKDLKVKWSKDVKDLKEFWGLNLVTAKRGGFTPHNFKHYLQIFKTPFDNEKNRVEIAIASHNGKAIAANLMLFFNKTVYYLHGASDNENRNLMAPYLLHWEAIQKAKKEGFEMYDFWGIDKKKWPGVTRFKEGFGGIKMDYPPIYETPLRNYPYKMYRFYRQMKG